MIDVRKLKPGTQVLVESRHNSRFPKTGSMDRFLGSIMTVSKEPKKSVRNHRYVKMLEDDGVYCWFPEMIDLIINCDQRNSRLKGERSMVSIKDLHVGDRVLVVSERIDGVGFAINGGMDDWLGKIVTVDEVYDGSFYRGLDKYVRIKEDGHAWYWFERMFERKLEEWEDADTIMNEPTDVGFEHISDISVFTSVMV